METSRRGVLLGAIGVSGLAAGGVKAAGPDIYLRLQWGLEKMVAFRDMVVPPIPKGVPYVSPKVRLGAAQWDYLHTRISSMADSWMEEMFDTLFTAPYNTQGPEAIRAQVEAMFSKEALQIGNVDQMRSLEGTAVSVAFIKTALSTQRLPFNTPRMTQFEVFAENCKHYILTDHRVDRATFAKYVAPEVRGPGWQAALESRRAA